MAIPLLVVDDSSLSRKMVIKSLPAAWEVEITQASNGLEAIEACRAGKGHVMLLDLTMPVMDGFQVLEKVQTEQLKCLVIVVSADIQPKAQERVKELGALAFIKKPIKTDELESILKRHGIL